MRLVYCGTGWLPVIDMIRARLPAGAEIRARDPARSLHDELRDAQVILPSNCAIDAAAIAAPSDLRLIQQPAAGVDSIDLAAAHARGVPVCNAPGANQHAVAETALLLMLACARRWRQAERAFAAGAIGVPVGTELAGKTLGIIGLGASGAALAKVAQALDMRVIATRSGSTRAELLALLASAHVISLHAPLTVATRWMLGPAELDLVGPGAILINCARGALADRAAVVAALDAGRLAAVGLDVHWHEPWDPADPLYRRDDVVTLPHIGGSSVEALGRIADIVADNVGRLMRRDDLRFRIIKRS